MKNNLPSTNCPYEQSIRLLGNQWTLRIITEMHFKKKPIRFNEFMKSIKPISSKTLSSKLKELADFGVIKKEVLTDQTPVLVLYSLTEKGQQLTPILDTIAQWNLKWRTKNN